MVVRGGSGGGWGGLVLVCLGIVWCGCVGDGLVGWGAEVGAFVVWSWLRDRGWWCGVCWVLVGVLSGGWSEGVGGCLWWVGRGCIVVGGGGFGIG